MHLTGNDNYHNFLVFVPIFNLVTFDDNKVRNWISTGILPEKNKPFVPSIAPFMCNGRVNKKFSISILVQNNFSLL